jgi:hypothetical protein
MAARSRDKTAPATGIRAPRYPVRAPVRYRTKAEKAWHDGTTQNVSRSGILLRGDAYLEPDTPIELIVDLPAILAEEPRGSVVCHGRIVRTEAFETGEQGTVIAAEFSSYRFRRAPH